MTCLLNPQGVWRVFYAPHIRSLSSLANARFDPILYIIEGTDITSNVQYKSPLFGSGWLNTEGTVKPLDGQEDVVQVLWHSVWFNFGDHPSENPVRSRILCSYINGHLVCLWSRGVPSKVWISVRILF